MQFKTVISFAFLFVCLFFQTSLQANDSYKWPHEVYKQEPFPNAKIGILKNGFRYVIVPNQTPEKRVFIELLVEVGSLMEKDHQQGLAHFLEHMAFNGTKNYPGNSLIEYFKEIGMAFGADANALTSFDETIYKLNLPDESHMNAGLNIIDDYMQNITFDEKEIEKERGVILGEKRIRDNISYRLNQGEFKFTLGTTLIPNRSPIGTTDCINSLQKKDFLDFYTTWYRPDRMVLFIVGDINSEKWEEQVKSTFEKIKKPKKKVILPQIGRIKHEGLKINYIAEEEFADVRINVSTLFMEETPKFEKYEDFVLTKLADYAAKYMIDVRLMEKIQAVGSPATTASFNTTYWIYDLKGLNITAHCKPENWKNTLHLIEQEIRKALSFGFLDSEIEFFRKAFIFALETPIKDMATRSSTSILESAQSSFKSKIPFIDDRQRLDLQLPLIKALDKDFILARLKYHWDRNHRLVSVVGNLKLEDGEEKIRQAWNESAKIEIKKQEQEKEPTFPYLPTPTETVKHEREVVFQDLGIKRLFFSNNVVLNLKKTSFKTNEILIDISFGTGAHGVPKNKEYLAHISDFYFQVDGLGKFTRLELRKALTDKSVGLNFNTQPTRFALYAFTNKDDLEIQLNLLRTFLLDPGYHADSKKKTLNDLDQFYVNANKDAIQYFRNTFVSLILADDPSYALALEPRITDFDVNDLKTWLDDEFKNGQMEINVCGDLDPKDTVDLVSKYFGTLPKRKELKPVAKKVFNPPEGKEIIKVFPSAIAKSIIAYQIKTTDYSNIENARLLHILSLIIDDKVRKKIREELSLSYSASAKHDFNVSYQDFGALLVTADIDVGKENIFIEEVEKILKNIVNNDITNEEFQSVLKPTLNHIDNIIGTNSYWVGDVLTGSTLDDSKFDAIKTIRNTYKNMKVEDINRIAKKYLHTEKALKFIVKSQK